MKRADLPPEDGELEGMLRRDGGLLESPADHPDALDLAAFAEGTLTPADHARVVAHLADCESCRRAVATVTVGGAARATRRIRWAAAAAAAAAVIAIAVLALRPDAPAGTDARLQAAVEALSRSEPGLFMGFRPLSAAERRSPGSPLVRGGVTLVAPTATVLETRPPFRWKAVPGITSWRVEVRRLDGTTVAAFDASGTSAAYPPDVAPLAPGERFVWMLRGENPLGVVEARRDASVASEEARVDFDRASAAIRSKAPDLADLLLAHWAFRHDLLVEAERHALAAASRQPDDPVAAETLALARRRLGE